MEDRLLRALAGVIPGAVAIERLRPLSGGAVQETWVFEATGPGGVVPLVLRRARGSLRADRRDGINLATEAEVVQLAEHGGVPVPRIRHVLRPQDELGEGFIMDFVEGETIPRRILRDQAFATLRSGLAAECGATLATIHRLDTHGVRGLAAYQPAAAIERIYQDYLALDAPGAVFELALRWLRDNMIPDLERLCLVHGDFRLGNLLVGPDRLRAVLDWEGAHLGDPHEDLGYIAITSWRFGEIGHPVGGFGTREALVEAYEAAGGRKVDPARVRFWELAYTMNWGIQCAQMAVQFLMGADPSVERGAIGRRRSETELDLLNLLDRSGSRA
jgi:aminoglycoside phosphotransferase (APT) family kinase protein